MSRGQVVKVKGKRIKDKGKRLTVFKLLTLRLMPIKWNQSQADSKVGLREFKRRFLVSYAKEY